MEKTSHPYTDAVTFGRFRIVHHGHCDLVVKMLEHADTAHVFLSTGKGNNDLDARVALFEHLLRLRGVDLHRVFLCAAPNPWVAVSAIMESVVDPRHRPVIVLGEDQDTLLQQLMDDFHLGGIHNPRRTSSSAIRELLDHGNTETVRINEYDGNAEATRMAIALRAQELAR
jgi:glycerol-3-phosphate cytidylyltransferase-like family protein